MSGIGKLENEAHGRTTQPCVDTPMRRHADEVAHDRSTGAGEIALETDSEKLTKLQAQNVELKYRLLRALADLENVRQRGEREVRDARQYAIADFAGAMLHVADNLGRALASVPAEAIQPGTALAGVIEGIALTEKDMLRALEKHGIRKLHPVGERFDPNFHEALFQVFAPSLRDGTITKVMQDGYAIGSRALRPAKVAVSSGEAQTSP